jgi:UrcA family protein
MRAFILPLAAALLAAPALAEDAPQLRVSYADLDLSTREGAARLERRVAAAAKVVCGVADTRDIAMQTKTRACRKAALASAQAPMRQAVLAARAERQFAGLRNTAAR